ncbi:MAG: 30S ribosomal protein S12 methylthiotransferase RimO [Clostridia bacterium]|nr:30S ribosomal protein S12 methylthiotransferase RimO [Clostridia bacterium]
MSKVGMISLGCPKNQVDAEMLLSRLNDSGFEIVGDVEADIVIINTCGFIGDAKKEAIDTILEICQLKDEGIVGAVVVTGCLAQRYKEEIMKEIPEVDAVVGIGGNIDIVSVCRDVLRNKKVNFFPPKLLLPLEGDRMLTTPAHYAYLKIAEGCSNCCTYCAIPKIRGKFRSREMENIIAEAKSLAANGVKELIVVAQDTTKYGIDLYGELKLSELLRELCRIDGIEWIRTLYCYPESITDELIDTMASESKICKYIDIPLQHCDGSVLGRMNRKGDRESLTALICKLRERIPGIIIRTTFIVGFPGETEKSFESLCEFADEMKFDRYGCFAYSAEEDTPAALMENQIDEDIKAERAGIMNSQQQRIFEDKLEALLGKELTVIVDGFDEEEMLYFGRSYMDAPDIDTVVIISSEEELTAGQFVMGTVKGSLNGELIVEIMNEEL